ncbi:hypothetical protein OEZ86_005123 [Tetradesmus obliquus]|nr:hypothetical protein OEZ86_005123 [Tetradesmus obliquus]
MHLVVGTYERFLLGYSLPAELQEGCQLQRSFTHAAHQGPVRCLDAAGPWVVSGGQDDQLHIYDAKHNKDLGFMMNPGDGAIPCLQFYTPPGAQNPSHLFSGSDDGSIAIWKAGGGWEHLKLMRGHKGPVRSLSVHPSGRLALSVGHDRGLRMWNLAKGRCSYTARLEAEADLVAFNASGDAYALLCDKLVTLHSAAQEGAVTARLQHSRRVVSLLQQQDGAALLAGTDDGSLALWDLRAAAQQPVFELAKAHSSRIRAIVAVTPAAGGEGPPLHLATASSDGVVKLWDSRALSSSSSSSLQELAQVPTSGRITGMVLSAPERKAAAAAAIGAGGAAAAAANGQQAQKKKKQKKPQQKQQQQQQQLDAVADGEQPQQQQQQPLQQQQQVQQPAKQQQQVQQRSKLQQQPAKKQKQKHSKAAAAVADADTALVPRVQTKIIKKKKKSREEMQRAVDAAIGAAKPKGEKQQQRPGKKAMKQQKSS